MSLLSKDLLRRQPIEERSQRRVCIGGETLDVTLIRSRRRRRKLSLQLDAKGGLIVRAPFAARIAEIDGLMLRNSEWITQRRLELQQQPRPQSFTFIHGEYHLFLGQHYALDIRLAANRGHQRLVITGDQLLVYAAAPDAVSRLLRQWYSEQAESLFQRRLAYYAELLAWVPAVPELRLRRMRSRWGSCSSKGRLCLNTHLIKASERCIDYVIVHELCHLQEFNHSARFYALMDAAMPDWRARKAELEACGGVIIRE